MKGKLFLILSLLLLANKSNSQTFYEINVCFIDRLGFKVFTFIWEAFQVVISLSEEKAKAFYLSHKYYFDTLYECMLLPRPELELKTEAENIIQNLFNITYKITVVTLYEEYVIHENPKITLKLKNKCDFDFAINSRTAYYKIEGGTVISQKGMDTTFPIDIINKITTSFGVDIEKMYINVSRKLKDAIYEGTVYTKVYLDKIEFGFILTKKINDRALCEGTIIITIEAGYLPPTPPPAPAPAPAPEPQPVPVPEPEPFHPPIFDWNKIFEFLKDKFIPGIIAALVFIIVNLAKFIKEAPIKELVGAI